jgi:hypothetical protein
MTFKANVRPEFGPAAEYLIDVYEKTYGAAGPGCNPASLAAVLRAVHHMPASKVLQIADELNPTYNPTFP